MLWAFKVNLEPGDGVQSARDSADSDTPIYRTLSRAVSEQFQRF